MPFTERGYIYFENKFYADALREFKRMKEINPTNPAAVANLKEFYERIKSVTLPTEEYDKLLQSEPANADFFLGRSKRYFMEKNFNDVIKDASKAIELNPNYAEAYYSRAVGFCEIGKRKESMADVASHDRLSGKKTNGICQIDIKVCDGKDDDCRMEVFTEGINKPAELAPGWKNNLSNYYVGRGIIYYKREDFDRALSDFDDADRRDGGYDVFEKSFLQGSVYLRKGDYDKALNKFLSAAELKSNSAESFLGIGEIYLIKREYEKALENYDKALFLDKRLWKAYLGRGTIYFEQGRIYEDFENNREKAFEFYKKAVKDFDSVTEIDLKEVNPEVYIRRAKTFERLGESGKAEADRAKVRELADQP